jgi:hypothetical protein
MTTVAMIKDPPKKVFNVGTSFKKMKAIIIPKIG